MGSASDIVVVAGPDMGVDGNGDDGDPVDGDGITNGAVDGDGGIVNGGGDENSGDAFASGVERADAAVAGENVLDDDEGVPSGSNFCVAACDSAASSLRRTLMFEVRQGSGFVRGIDGCRHGS